MTGYRRFLPVAICIGLFLLAFAACNKSKGDDQDEPPIHKISTILNFNSDAAARYRDLRATMDTLDALVSLGKWAIQQPNVEKAYLIGDNVIELHFKNGLRSSIMIAEQDERGMSRTRGGGGGQKLTRYNLDDEGEYLIGNRKVLVFSPFHEEFYPAGVYPYSSMFQSGKHKLTETFVQGAAADFSVIKRFHEFGLIILDTHGLPTGFQMLTKIPALDVPKAPDGKKYSDDELTTLFATANNLPVDAVVSGDIDLGLNISVRNGRDVLMSNIATVTYKYVRQLTRLNKAVVFGNHCYSGTSSEGVLTNNMIEAWKSIGAACYFGYAFEDGKSMAVDNVFARRMEDSLLRNLVVEGDSTGTAHLAGNVTRQFQESGIRIFENSPVEVTADLSAIQYSSARRSYKGGPFYFHSFISDRYKYGCGSITDSRDGEIYQLACIGDQTWMAENLRFNAPGSRIYGDDAANLPVYGRLYNYKVLVPSNTVAAPTAKGLRGICPEGFHVPSKMELDKLMATLTAANGGTNLGTQLKAKNAAWTGDPTVNAPLRDISGFNAMPGGFLDDPGPGFSDKGKAAHFWLSSTLGSTKPIDRALFQLYGTSTSVDSEEGDPDDGGLSCRCLQD